MIRLTKISCAGPSYESICTLSYSFKSGPGHQQIYSSLKETEQVSLCFHARIQRGSRGSGPPGESHTMLRTKNDELFSDSRAWTPPPLQRFLDLRMALHSVLITTVQWFNIESVIFLLKDFGLRVYRCARLPVA